jgi:superoxide dismutase
VALHAPGQGIGRQHDAAGACDSLARQALDDLGNERVAVTLFSELSTEHLIYSAACRPEYTSLFRAAAPHWNSAYPWRALDPRSDAPAAQALQPVLQGCFAIPPAHQAGAAGSPVGLATSSYRWIWLALSGVRLKVDARDRLGLRTAHVVPVRMALDTWEAAYFLDFQNQPRSRLQRVVDRLRHWRFSVAGVEAG